MHLGHSRLWLLVTTILDIELKRRLFRWRLRLAHGVRIFPHHANVNLLLVAKARHNNCPEYQAHDFGHGLGVILLGREMVLIRTAFGILPNRKA